MPCGQCSTAQSMLPCPRMHFKIHVPKGPWYCYCTVLTVRPRLLYLYRTLYSASLVLVDRNLIGEDGQVQVLRDPKQKRFFKSKDIHDLFTLGDQYAGASETAHIFSSLHGGLEVPLDPDSVAVPAEAADPAGTQPKSMLLTVECRAAKAQTSIHTVISLAFCCAIYHPQSYSLVCYRLLRHPPFLLIAPASSPNCCAMTSHTMPQTPLAQ